mgnify:CR=1 FL=1
MHKQDLFLECTYRLEGVCKYIFENLGTVKDLE